MTLAGTVYIGPTTEFWQQANSWESVCAVRASDMHSCWQTVSQSVAGVRPSRSSVYWLNVCTVSDANKLNGHLSPSVCST